MEQLRIFGVTGIKPPTMNILSSGTRIAEHPFPRRTQGRLPSRLCLSGLSSCHP